MDLFFYRYKGINYEAFFIKSSYLMRGKNLPYCFYISFVYNQGKKWSYL